MPGVSVLMATYNGRRFIREQLDSLLAQTYEDWHLYIQDDGSIDDTLNIVKAYQDRDRRIHILPSAPPNIGACGNFTRLMERAPGYYFMFCDQDDIWLPDKVATTLNVMKDSENRYRKETPLLVHTDCKVIDPAGRFMSKSFMQYQHMKHVEKAPLRVLLTQNFVTGCTVMINRPLLTASMPVPSAAIMYDWWLALVAAALGRLVFVPYATLLYRQHGDNVAGAKKIFSRRNLKRSVKHQELNAAMANLMMQNYALEEHLDNRNDVKAPHFLKDFLLAASQGGITPLKCAMKHKIAKQGLLRNIYFYYLLARGEYFYYMQLKSAE